MNVNELLDTIEDALEESANVPLSGGKRIVDVEQVRQSWLVQINFIFNEVIVY